jgi:hypothetical protein
MAEAKKTYEVIPAEDNGLTPDPYALVEELVERHHDHLADAKIAIAWRYGWKPDPDGRLTLGQLKVASELDRDLHGYDIVILLNYEIFTGVKFTLEQQRALLDHELCHAAIATDSEDEAKVDAEGRAKYRMRKHTLEEFHEVVARHGLYKGDIEAFAAVCMKAAEDCGQGALFADQTTGQGAFAMSGPAAKIARVTNAVKALSAPERVAFDALLNGDDKAYHKALDKLPGVSATVTMAN